MERIETNENARVTNAQLLFIDSIQTGTSLIVHDKFAAGFENWPVQLPFNSSPGRYRVTIPSTNGLASGISVG